MTTQNLTIPSIKGKVYLGEHLGNNAENAKQLLDISKSFEEEKKRISVVIPTKNEAESIGEIIKQCRPYAGEIIVVDGHSTDDTQKIAESMGVKVVLDNKRGKGDAIRVSRDHISGDFVVFVDADFSHDPTDIPRLIAPLVADECDHVTGSRMRGGSDELHGDFYKFIRMIGSDIITLGINYRFNVRLTDSQNGFRAMKASMIRALDLRENITTIEQEMVIKTLAAGYRMGEVATHEYARRFGDSNISLRKVAFRYVYSWMKYLITA